MLGRSAAAWGAQGKVSEPVGETEKSGAGQAVRRSRLLFRFVEI